MSRTSHLYSTPPRKSDPKSDMQPQTGPTTTHDSTPGYSLVKMLTDQCLSDLKHRNTTHGCRTPNTHKDQNILEDRFIPSRRLIHQFHMYEGMENSMPEDPQAVTMADVYSEQVLKTRVRGRTNENDIQSFRNQNLLKFKSEASGSKDTFTEYHCPLGEVNGNYAKNRKVTKYPMKVLDAPNLSDDFYLKLVDWSSTNQLAVGLDNCVYLWNGYTSQVSKLCQIKDNFVTAVCWSPKGDLLAVGCNDGTSQIWDVNRKVVVRVLRGHELRVGSMSWSNMYLSTGSRDTSILQADMRSPLDYVAKWAQHTEEICGLKWSQDHQMLASGGNDNKVLVWNVNGHVINKFNDHVAAVKALAWSPFQHGLLATGGGTADRCIKLRNVLTGELLHCEDTGSQVCSLEFSKNLKQLVSTHGYSQNQINLWSCPNMKKVATLTGHTRRVLHLALSPDGSTIVTGASDDTLRFWEVFPSAMAQSKDNDSLLENGICFR